MLSFGFRLVAAVLDCSFHYAEVEERFTAEEVHIKVTPGAGLIKQEVNGCLGHPKGHELPRHPEVSGLAKAILAP